MFGYIKDSQKKFESHLENFFKMENENQSFSTKNENSAMLESLLIELKPLNLYDIIQGDNNGCEVPIKNSFASHQKARIYSSYACRKSAGNYMGAKDLPTKTVILRKKRPKCKSKVREFESFPVNIVDLKLNFKKEKVKKREYFIVVQKGNFFEICDL